MNFTNYNNITTHLQPVLQRASGKNKLTVQIKASEFTISHRLNIGSHTLL